MQTNEDGLPRLVNHSQEGFVDLAFQIRGVKHEAGRISFTLAAYDGGKELGLNVSVDAGIKPGLDAGMTLVEGAAVREGVIFSRSGPESDWLITALARLYDLETDDVRMVDEERFTAIMLAQGEANILQTPVRIKIFGRDGADDDEDDYYESFFNIDLSAGYAYWNEKDPSYRKALIRALSY